MSRKSELDNRKVSFGHKMKHRRGSSGGGGAWKFRSHKTNRTWVPNLRDVKVVKNGVTQTIKVSMKAYKKLKAEGSYNGATIVVRKPKEKTTKTEVKSKQVEPKAKKVIKKKVEKTKKIVKSKKS